MGCHSRPTSKIADDRAEPLIVWTPPDLHGGQEINQRWPWVGGERQVFDAAVGTRAFGRRRSVRRLVLGEFVKKPQGSLAVVDQPQLGVELAEELRVRAENVFGTE